MSRAMRRHHAQRLKTKRRHYWNGYAGTSLYNLGRVLKDPAPCSCEGCGNQRKYQGQTLQEKRHQIEFSRPGAKEQRVNSSVDFLTD